MDPERLAQITQRLKDRQNQNPASGPASMEERGFEIGGADAPRMIPANPEDILIPDPPEDFEESAFIPVTAIPSGGIPYPVGYRISFRPYVFGEIKIASGGRDMPFGEMAQILMKGIKTTFPIQDLTFYDFLYISLLRKISSIRDEKILASHECTQKDCKSINTYEIDISPENCEIEFWELDFKELPVTVILGDKELKFRPLTLGQFLQLERVRLEKDPVSILAMQCENLPFMTARSLLFWSMNDYEDSDLLNRVEEILNHGTKPFRVRCSACNHINYLQIDGGGVVIRPFRSDAKSVNARIRFGETSPHPPADPGEDGLHRSVGTPQEVGGPV